MMSASRCVSCKYDIMRMLNRIVWGIMGVDANHQSICVSPIRNKDTCD